MVRQFVSRFRNEINAADVGGAVVLVAVLSLLGLESTAIGVLLGIVVGVPLVRAAVDATDLDLGPGLAGVVLGALVATVGVGGLLDGNPWFGWALVAIGCWICLDGIDKQRHGLAVGDATTGETVSDVATTADKTTAGAATENGTPTDGTTEDDDISTDELYRLGEHNRWLVDELREADRPLTAEEIQSHTGLTEEDFERVLEVHGESGPIERVGNGYAIDEDDLGTGAFVRNLVRTIGGRILRPFRLFRPTG